MVDSCGTCAGCKAGEEQKCSKQVGTYNGKDFSGRAETYPVGGQTLGGYTQKMVVHEKFGINLPKTYPLEYAGPIMCAGITMYDPMIKAGVKAGDIILEFDGEKLHKAVESLAIHEEDDASFAVVPDKFG